MRYMNQMLELSFGDSPAEQLLGTLQSGDKLSAVQLLAALDGESEEILEELLASLRNMDVLVDITDLPRYSADSELALRLRREAQLATQKDMIPELEETDPLRMYLEELSLIPACGDINVLAEELLQNNARGGASEEVCAKMLNLSLSRIVELACEFAGNGVLLMDLIQEGSLGLWEALHEYSNGEFEIFRDRWVRWYMTKAVISQAYASGVGQRLRQAMEDYRSVDERLLTELGRNPTVEEIAEAMHVQPQEAGIIADMVAGVRNLNRMKQPEPEQIPQEEDQAVEDTAYFQMRQRIQELLSGLSDEDAKLLSLRYGLEGGLPLDPQHTGAKLGLTVQEVINREAAALAKLRQ